MDSQDQASQEQRPHLGNTSITATHTDRSSSWRGRRLTLWSALASTVVLAGCTGGDVTPSTPPTETAAAASTSPTASPSTTALSDEELLAMMPEDTYGTDLTSALRTAEFWVETLSEAFAELDTSTLAALSLPECDYCASQIENISGVRAASYTTEGGSISPDHSSVRLAPGDSDDVAYVSLEADIAALTLVASSGEKSIAEEASRSTFWFDLRLVNGHWKVEGVDIGDPQ